MYRIFIIIGILILIFTFSGKAQVYSKCPVPGKMMDSAMFNLPFPYVPGYASINIDDNAQKIKELHKQLILLEMQRNIDQTQKICENYCLNYCSYKKYRKCMLIFNK